eukprot:1669190-Amphidinium_carterae.3
MSLQPRIDAQCVNVIQAQRAKHPRATRARARTLAVLAQSGRVGLELRLKGTVWAWEEDRTQELRWSVARDVVGTKVLQAQDCNADTKVRWLQYLNITIVPRAISVVWHTRYAAIMPWHACRFDRPLGSKLEAVAQRKERHCTWYGLAG